MVGVGTHSVLVFPNTYRQVHFLQGVKMEGGIYIWGTVFGTQSALVLFNKINWRWLHDCSIDEYLEADWTWI